MVSAPSRSSIAVRAHMSFPALCVLQRPCDWQVMRNSLFFTLGTAISSAGLRSSSARWVSVPLRLIVGYGFLAHGIAKAARGYDAFPSVLQQIGIPAPHLLGWATILVEIAGGLAVLSGAFIPIVSVPMIVVLLVATFTVHIQYGFSSIKLLGVTSAGAQFGPPGYETDLLYLACIAALLLGGAGPFSIERFLRRRRS